MKRLILLTLALALLLVLPATAENRLLEANEDSYFRAVLAVGDALVLVENDVLYTWREGDAALTAWTPDFKLENPYWEENGAQLYELAFFDDGGALRGMRLLRDDGFSYRGLQLFDVVFSDGGTVGGENAVELALPGDIGSMEWFDLKQVVCREGLLYVLGEGENMALCVIDPEKPRAASLQTLQSWDSALTALPDGALLATSSYDSDGRLELFRVDANGSLEPLCPLDADADSVAADPVTGTVYAASEGRVCPVDLMTGELGEAVAALSLEVRCAAVTPGGDRYAAAMQNGGVAVLETGSRLDEDAVLRISSSRSDEWLNRAVQRFALEHPEITPVLGYDPENVLEAMMTRSANTDVYIMDLQYTADYQALLERGFMLPLDGSETLRALYERVYPGIQPFIGRDGVPMALPVAVNSSTMGIDDALLEKLGLSAAEVPDSWPEFLDFMERELRPRLDRLGEHESFTYDDMTADGLRYFLFTAILRDWAQASRAAGVVTDYEDPRLVETLEKLDAMDFTAYGLPEDEDGEDGFGYGWGGETRYLLQIGSDFTPGNVYGIEGTPIALGFGGDLPGVFSLSLSCAFVNPYSPRAEAAVTFLASLADALPAEVEYALCPDLNEPVKRDDWEKRVAEWEESVANWEAKVESATAAEKQEAEEILDTVRREYDSFMRLEIWLVPEGRLQRYRALGDRLTVALPTWFEQDGEAWELMEQYRSRVLSARDFLREVNGKARMMELERG